MAVQTTVVEEAASCFAPLFLRYAICLQTLMRPRHGSLRTVAYVVPWNAVVAVFVLDLDGPFLPTWKADVDLEIAISVLYGQFLD